MIIQFNSPHRVLKRQGQPEDIAGLVSFMVSKVASYITGIYVSYFELFYLFPDHCFSRANCEYLRLDLPHANMATPWSCSTLSTEEWFSLEGDNRMYMIPSFVRPKYIDACPILQS